MNNFVLLTWHGAKLYHNTSEHFHKKKLMTMLYVGGKNNITLIFSKEVLKNF